MHVCRWRMTNIQCCLSISRGVIQLVSELESISPSLLHLPSGPSPFHLSVITFPQNLTSSDCYECWHLNILSVVMSFRFQSNKAVCHFIMSHHTEFNQLYQSVVALSICEGMVLIVVIPTNCIYSIAQC